MHERRRILIPVVVLLILLAAGAWYVAQGRNGGLNGPLQASGTVEAAEVSIAPELAGRVTEVLAEKGQVVEAGQALLRLDDELLQSQRKRGEAAVEAARANLTTTQAGLEMAEATIESARAGQVTAQANAKAELLPAQQALDDLYENAELARAAADREMAAANRAVRETTYLLDNYIVPTEQEGMTAVAAVEEMKKRLDQARENFEPYKFYSSSNPNREDLKDALDQAQSDYDAAVRRLEYETAVDQAQARLDKAIKDLEMLKDGPNPDDVANLEARIAAFEAAPKQAEAAVQQAEAGLTQAQTRVQQAEAALAQAQAELDLIDVQLKKLVVYAPESGVVLSRHIEQGEVVQAGAPVMTLGQLDNLKITVYVPEDRYGAINLGETARVTVDSFPGEEFSATVVHIADQAEFTPRNVQTAEGRKTTVFAVELEIENPGGKLKPGMPADVCFGCR